MEEIVTRHRSHSISSAPIPSATVLKLQTTPESPLEGFLKTRNNSVATRVAQQLGSSLSRGDICSKLLLNIQYIHTKILCYQKTEMITDY